MGVIIIALNAKGLLGSISPWNALPLNIHVSLHASSMLATGDVEF